MNLQYAKRWKRARDSSTTSCRTPEEDSTRRVVRWQLYQAVLSFFLCSFLSYLTLPLLALPLPLCDFAHPKAFACLTLFALRCTMLSDKPT